MHSSVHLSVLTAWSQGSHVIHALAKMDVSKAAYV